ncbi:hypothetical protein [Bradyrhizobium sp. STM 3557]|uniref:hypothetical protein n=1 Tax=Bradyrhizobium sp. STM 3557 TaxID=578920 RepID=UPI00388CF97E
MMLRTAIRHAINAATSVPADSGPVLCPEWTDPDFKHPLAGGKRASDREWRLLSHESERKYPVKTAG